MTDSCLFCKIANHEIPTEFLLETDKIVAFRDISPQAPIHILIIPKKHIASIATLQDGDGELIGEIMIAIRDLADEIGLEQGFRVVINTGEHGGQTVSHLHFHLLGGRELMWPPG